MFIVLTYDVSSKKASKTIKVCRRYLRRVQKSVFEGNLTNSQLERLKEELFQIIDVENDSVLIYCLESTRYTRKEQIGLGESNDCVI